MGHPDSSIDNVEGVVLLVGLDHDLEVGCGLQDVGVGQGQEPDLVESVRRVRDQFSQEDLRRKDMRYQFRFCKLK